MKYLNNILKSLCVTLISQFIFNSSSYIFFRKCGFPWPMPLPYLSFLTWFALTFGPQCARFDVLRWLFRPGKSPGKVGRRGHLTRPKPGAEIVRRNLLRPATNILGLSLVRESGFRVGRLGFRHYQDLTTTSGLLSSAVGCLPSVCGLNDASELR